jgi:hypothetical protein
MPKEQVFTQQISIARKGEIKNFQFRIPLDVQKIIAVETGIRMVSALAQPATPASFTQSLRYIPARVMGELRLQHVGKGGLFFSTHVIEQDTHLPYADFSMVAGFTPKDYTHSAKREPVWAEVEREAPILFGWYRDIAGAQADQHLQYVVLVHLWYQAKEAVQ